MMNIPVFLSKSIFGLLLFISFNATSQHTMICTMEHRQIMQIQSFTEDAVEAEEAREIFKSFANTLILAYNNINNHSIEELQLQKTAINTFIDTFQTLGLNYGMYQDDIEFIINYNL